MSVCPRHFATRFMSPVFRSGHVPQVVNAEPIHTGLSIQSCLLQGMPPTGPDVPLRLSPCGILKEIPVFSRRIVQPLKEGQDIRIDGNPLFSFLPFLVMTGHNNTMILEIYPISMHL
jgi:hypothetical protein